MRVLHLLDWSYPCDHPFLTNVYAKILSEDGHEMVWVMRSDEHISELQYREWNGQAVYVLPGSDYDPMRTMVRKSMGRIGDHPVASIVRKHGPFDFTQVRNDLAMGLVATYLRSEHHIPFVQQISHLKAETEMEVAKRGLEDSRIRRYLKGYAGKQLRQYVSDSANLVFPISDAMDQYLKANGLATPTVPVYTGADTSFHPSHYQSESFRERFDIPDEPILLYMGTLAPIRRLEFLFEMLQHLDERVEVHLVIMGGRDKKNQVRLETEARRHGVRDDVTFTGWVSNEKTLNNGIVAADVGLSPIPTDGILRTNAPLKVLEYLNLATPVVATDTPDQRRVLDGSGGGYVVAYDVAAFADAVETVLNSDSSREMGRQGRAYIEENRSYETLADVVLNAYKRHIIN